MVADTITDIIAAIIFASSLTKITVGRSTKEMNQFFNLAEKSIDNFSVVIKYWSIYCATVDYDRGNGAGAAWEISGALSTKNLPRRLRESINQ